MSLGAGIFLFAVGAILAFAVNVSVDWVNLQVIGYILMAAGLVGIILGIVLITRKRTATSTTATGVDPVSGESVRRSVRTEDQI
ncbi:DUF6458 family protein [Amnibacterium flavum]|uniref:DUF6458 domain-containing protein n=1 Tax=Amnibacterium flavum TaxID=2173173 RepID=A0A2V1HS64_9MICO|nr:DUF6458 family protein [Amnibacterium flavum]PVZ95181.1 hypothetical protein DDQ50_01235 [Amnibacterium flavum]